MFPVLCSPVTTSDLSYPPNYFDLELFPNPANERLFIGIGKNLNANQTIELKVVNMLGEVVYMNKVSAHSSTLSLDLAEYANGLYILELKQNENLSIKKFQVNH
jgi:hypothetical protein